MADYVVRRVQQAVAVPPLLPHHSVVADHRPPPVSQRTRGGQGRRRQALEQEVAELKQQLCNEQTVHDILERALQQPSSSSVVLGTIPSFIPAKAKELLAELVLVEEEIARLENQIKTMKASAAAAAAATPPCPPATDVIKSMFFISQAMAAMDGDYLMSKVMKSPSRDGIIRRNIMTTSPTNKSSSAAGLPSPRHSLDNKQQQQPPPPPKKKHAVPVHHHELPIITTTTNTSTNNKSPPNQNYHHHQLLLQPNKLSERIVKCLVCIFIRLLRSSRVAEQQMDNNKQQSTAAGSHHQQGGGSFRMDTAVLSATNNSCSGQQDHYGIFGIPDAIVRDVGPYKNLVRFTTTSSLDLRPLGGVSSTTSPPLLTKLRDMMEALQLLDLRPLNHNQKLAFWINIYNTCIMHGILQHGLPSNPDKLLALKNKATINVSGHKFNALVIENFILRQPSSVKEEFWKCDVDVEEQAVRELYGLKSSEPNILFALCCGIRSSPALRIYKADRVSMDLEKAKLEYLQASLVVTTTRRVMIPSLIHSSMHDFAKDMETLVRWICEQLPTSWSLRKSMVDCLCLRGSISSFSTPSSPNKPNKVVDVIPFDYDFQYLLPMM